MENSTVINLCGNYPENFEKADVLSDPNYVFKNDSSYQAVQLYDNELNSVFVNSFVECEHALGGWDNSPTQFNEISYHTLLYNVGWRFGCKISA